MWPGTENTIRGKVVASPKFRPWWVLWVRVCPWFICVQKVFQLRTNQLVVWFVWFVWIMTMSQPHFGISVKVKPTLPKVGSRSLSGLPKTQSSSLGVKTPCIGVFFIPLESFWSVNVQNGLAWAIWTFAAQVMGKRRAGSQTGSLTPDH
jgi:hypothetical protein